MKTRTKSPVFNCLKWLILLSVAFVIIEGLPSCKKKVKASQGSASQADSNSTRLVPYNIIDNDTVWYRVDELPLFRGGDDSLMSFIARNITYPATAKKKEIQGRVVIGFVLTRECKVKDAKIIREIYPDCDMEALRVVNSLPVFEKPAMVDGKPVAYHFTLPVHFVLK
jgi:TonB family protein